MADPASLDQPSSCTTSPTAVDDDTICSADGDRYYAHPLQGLEPIDGQFPFVDFHRASASSTYVIAEGGRSLKEGDYEDLFFGVIEVESHALSEDERVEIEADKADQPPRVPEAVGKLGDSLREVIDDARDKGTMDTDVRLVELWVAREEGETVPQRINRAIVRGDILTVSDRHRVRQAIMGDVRREVAKALEPVLDRLRAWDVPVYWSGTHSPGLAAYLTPAQVEELERHQDVERMDLPPMFAGGGNADGREKAQAYQTRLNWDQSYGCDLGGTCNYDGENGTLTDIRVAVMDVEQFRDQHVAFRDATSSTDRIASMWDCTTTFMTGGVPGICCGNGTTCNVSVAAGGWTPPEGDHGTRVLGALLADYRDGQDSAITTTTAREQRSAAAGETHAYLYEEVGPETGPVIVYDHVADRSPAPHIFVSSDGWYERSEPDLSDCSGDLTIERAADDMFESGIAYFSLAHNGGEHGSSSNCTVARPSSAIGVFTIGGYAEGTGAACEMRTADIHAESNWGGSLTVQNEGKFRTILDMTAAYCETHLPSETSNTATDTNGSCGTSFATPSVASAAVAFIDMMKNVRGTNSIDDPGYLYAWMLNMGDRAAAGTSSKLLTRYNSRMGAGRLNLRFIGNAGMDSPWWWYQHEVCVDDGEVVTLSINGGSALSSSADSFRATAWWYDRRLETGTVIDDVDLVLRTTGGTLLRSGNSSTDNKERIYYDGVGGDAIKLEVVGSDVTSDGEGCGTNSMRVWVTILIEDDARNDGDGPSYNATTCEGVEPL